MDSPISRRDFFRYSTCLAAQASLPLTGQGASQRSQSSLPNLLFFLVDDLGWADIGCYGSDLHETPNIDRLAQQGMRFTQAYAAAPVWSPTRASIMTGKYPARLHMTTWYESSANPPKDQKLIPPITQGNLALEQVTITEVLQAAGYLTAHIGKWHLGDAGHYPHYYPTTTPVSSVRHGDYKLLHYHENDHLEMYDVVADPSEQNDLAGRMPDRAHALKERLDVWRKAVNAQMPEKNSK